MEKKQNKRSRKKEDVQKRKSLFFMLYKFGLTQVEIGSQYGITKGGVSYLIKTYNG
jgi:DNA-directed RNA polymerase specialized sigma subunit